MQLEIASATKCVKCSPIGTLQSPHCWEAVVMLAAVASNVVTCTVLSATGEIKGHKCNRSEMKPWEVVSNTKFNAYIKVASGPEKIFPSNGANVRPSRPLRSGRLFVRKNAFFYIKFKHGDVNVSITIILKS